MTTDNFRETVARAGEPERRGDGAETVATSAGLHLIDRNRVAPLEEQDTGRIAGPSSGDDDSDGIGPELWLLDADLPETGMLPDPTNFGF